MTLSHKEREAMKEAIYADFPKLKQLGGIVDELITYYDNNPEAFKEKVKQEERKEAKKNKKKKTVDEDKTGQSEVVDIGKFIIPDGITRIPAEEAEAVVKRLSANNIDQHETHEQERSHADASVPELCGA